MSRPTDQYIATTTNSGRIEYVSSSKLSNKHLPAPELTLFNTVLLHCHLLEPRIFVMVRCGVPTKTAMVFVYFKKNCIFSLSWYQH